MNELIDPPAIANLAGILAEKAAGVRWERTAATGAELGDLNLRARTGEFAIRRLLARDPDRALQAIQEWTSDPDEQVRRLASEGTRPYLPWAVRVPALVQRPEATLPILDALYRDSSEYVRRSVHYQKANGSQSAKVFKIATLTLAPGERRSLSKRHAFRQMTTRVHHPGLHALELQVNGAVHGRTEFLLETG